MIRSFFKVKQVPHFLAKVLLIVIGTALIASYFPRTLHIAHAADYNGNLLISDDLFTASTTFSSGADIQAWLVSKGSVLATLSSDQLGGGANGRTAGQIIYDATHSTFTGGVYDSYAGYNAGHPLVMTLNPAVILITLQKEESLILTKTMTDLTPYALRSALGMLCPDTSGCSSDAYGFTKQVIMGAAQLMINFVGSTNCPTYRAGNTVVLDGQNVTFSNAATAGLYCYTPHPYIPGTFEGNHNFWYYLSLWFSYQPSQFFTQARVIKSDTTPQVYLYWPQQQKKWYVDSLPVLTALGITASLETLPAATVNSVATGTGTLSLFQRPLISPDVLLLENGHRHHIKSVSQFSLYGKSIADVQPIDNIITDQFRAGPPLGLLSKSSINQDVYLLTANRKYYIPSEAMLRNWGYTFDDVQVLDPETMDLPPKGEQLSWLTKDETSPNIYVVSDSTRMYINSLSLLAQWRLAQTPVITLGTETSVLLPIGRSLSRLAKGSDSSVYYIDNGTRRYVSSFLKLPGVGLNQSDLVTVTNALLFSLPQGKDL